MFLREEFPIYKIMKFSPAQLADVELIALLIGGNAERAAEKARTMIATIGSLRKVGRISVRDLTTLGLSNGEAARVVGALELSRRYNLTDVEERPRVSCSRDAYNALAPLISDLHHEEFYVLYVNKMNEVFDRQQVSVGGTSGTVVDVKIVMREALLRRAAGIIIAHNHPSGSLSPSQADIEMTRRIKKAGEVMDLTLLDHLIISERGFYSFADEGMI